MQSLALVRWKTSGFTLVETLLALTIGGLVLSSLLHLFITQPQLSEGQDTMRDMVQNTRVALEVMTRELRMAGYNPTGVNFDGVTYAPTQLRLRADLNGDGDTDDPDEDIRYTYDAEAQQIIRADRTGQEPLAEHIQAFTLTSLDAQGKPTTGQCAHTATADHADCQGAAVGAPAIMSHEPNTYTATMTGVPPVAYNSTALHVQAMVDRLKERATVVYVPAAARSGEHWGTPTFGTTLQTPSTCQASHIVHYDTPGTRGRLHPWTTGCGVLLIEGDLELDGDFSWSGAILVTGSLHLTGGGIKQVTGGIVVAGAATLDAGAETSLVYCSEAIVQPTRSLPLRILTWRDDLPTTH